MTPDAVAQYLQHNPAFFEDYADLIAQIFVPHPHGGRAISLPERQILTLRGKVKSLEYASAGMVDAGRANDTISTRMHRLTLALLRLPKDAPERIIETLTYHLREDFSVPHAALRVWGVRSEFQALEDSAAVSIGAGAKLRSLAASATSPLKLPYCGPLSAFRHDDLALGEEAAQWFGDAAPHLKSIAVMSMIHVHASDGDAASGSGGLLVMASEDEERFYPSMGTLYLERLADLLAAALAQIFPAS